MKRFILLVLAAAAAAACGEMPTDPTGPRNSVMRAQRSAGAAGIMTTPHACSDSSQHTTQYVAGDVVSIRGARHSPGQVLPWTVTGTAASGHPESTVAHGAVQANAMGEFCVEVRTITAADDGNYVVNVGSRSSSYRVHRLALATTADALLATEYSWTIAKTASPSRLELVEGDEAVARYTVSVQRNVAANRHAVTGYIRVANTSAVTDAALDVYACVQYGSDAGRWTDLQACTPVRQRVRLAPGSSTEVQYAVEFAPDHAAAGYRAVAQVRDAHDGSVISHDAVPFTLPAEPTSTDGAAIRFARSHAEPEEEETLTGSASFHYDVAYACDDVSDSMIDSRWALIDGREIAGSAEVHVSCREPEPDAFAPLDTRLAGDAPLHAPAPAAFHAVTHGHHAAVAWHHPKYFAGGSTAGAPPATLHAVAMTPTLTDRALLLFGAAGYGLPPPRRTLFLGG